MQGNTDPSSQPNAPEADETDPPTTVDMAELMARVGGDRDLLRELCEVFLAEVPKMLANVQQALASEDGTAISRAAHGLKGAISVFGKGLAFRTSLSIEMAGRDGRIEEARAMLEALLAALESLNSELADLVARSRS